MSPNQILVRNLASVTLAITAITTAGLWLGAASRDDAAAQRYVPAPRASKPRSPIELGARLYEKKGCIGCHSIDGSPRVGPSFKGAWGSEVTLGDGVTLRFDEAYVRESLLHPQAQARAGYSPTMPSFDGVLKEREVEALIAFMRSLQ